MSTFPARVRRHVREQAKSGHDQLPVECRLAHASRMPCARRRAQVSLSAAGVRAGRRGALFRLRQLGGRERRAVQDVALARLDPVEAVGARTPRRIAPPATITGARPGSSPAAPRSSAAVRRAAPPARRRRRRDHVAVDVFRS